MPVHRLAVTATAADRILAAVADASTVLKTVQPAAPHTATDPDAELALTSVAVPHDMTRMAAMPQHTAWRWRGLRSRSNSMECRLSLTAS